ncbi:MAG: hypothetical protein ABIC40_01250, partial [bacterium]
MTRYFRQEKRKSRRSRERGVVLVSVLMFIAVILPVTLLILDTVRIESLLPVNEAYSKTAGDEADKGFYEALAAVMADQDRFNIDVTRDYLDQVNKPYIINTYPSSKSGKHEIDYLAEMWARHPDNETIFLVERSLDNVVLPAGAPIDENPDADPDVEKHSVPCRWQLMNVPFGMDDFGEYYDDGGDFPRMMLPFEYVGEDGHTPEELRAPAYYLDPSEKSMMNVQHEGNPASVFASQQLDADYWQVSPAEPGFYENVGRMDNILQFIPRPASYFRNTAGGTDPGISDTDAGLPLNEAAASFRFMRENNNAIDRLVYDGFFDYDDGTNSNLSQYLPFPPLQQAVTESQWANPFFGTTGGSAGLTAAFTSTNKEYKPMPGTITKYQLGAQEGDAVPGWHMSIVSDEAGRFPINSLLNIIYSSHNLDYNDQVLPTVRRDQYDADVDDVINNDDHPNHSGFLLAREMLVSLLISDEDMARLANSFDNNLYNAYQAKATYLLRQMMTRRIQLDGDSDFNRNGDLDDDFSQGEVFRLPDFGNNDSDTLEIAPPGDTSELDGSGRLGDGQDLWDGTWRVFTNPKEILSNFKGYDSLTMPGDSLPLSPKDFETLNDRTTVYSFDTEYAADPDHHKVVPVTLPIQDVRYNLNKMAPVDNPTTAYTDESGLFGYLDELIGSDRAISIINWREGLVDLNGDGDLNDEYIEQPVAATRYDPATKAYINAEGWPVSTITYRERNHPNFQNPSLQNWQVDLDYLNIKSLGDLTTIPMSIGQPLIAYSEAATAADDPDLVMRGLAPGPTTNLGDRGLYPDFTQTGTEIAYDDSDDVLRNDKTLTNQTTIENNRLHPSWGWSDSRMTYYDTNDLYVRDMLTDTEANIPITGDLPPDEADTTDNNFWSNFGVNIIGNAPFEMASPDINPSPAFDEVAYTVVAPGSGDDFLDPANEYRIATIRLDGTLEDEITSHGPGNFDYAPDFN